MHHPRKGSADLDEPFGVRRFTCQRQDHSEAVLARRSNRLSSLTAGLRVHESLERLAVIRTDGCELHPDSLSTFRPPHDSLRSDCGQIGRPTKDQVESGADGEHLLRKEAEPRLAQVFSIHDVVSRPFRQGDGQRCDDAPSRFPSFFCRHTSCTSSLSVAVTHFDVAPPFRAADAGLKPGATKPKCVTTLSVTSPQQDIIRQAVRIRAPVFKAKALRHQELSSAEFRSPNLRGSSPDFPRSSPGSKTWCRPPSSVYSLLLVAPAPTYYLPPTTYRVGPPTPGANHNRAHPVRTVLGVRGGRQKSGDRNQESWAERVPLCCLSAKASSNKELTA